MKKIFLIFVINLFVISSFAQTLKDVTMKGSAYDDKNRLVYTEIHKFKAKPDGQITEIQTKYYSPDGVQIAEVSSNFSKDPFVPDTLFTDFRFKEKQELTLDIEKNLIEMKLTNLVTGKVKSNSLKRVSSMVSGQGFHNYILTHFDNPKTDIKFIVLPKLDYFSFHFEKSNSEIKDQRQFSLKITNWILRALVKEIIVTYNEKDRSLLIYNGLSNLESTSRDSQIVKILMSYL